MRCLRLCIPLLLLALVAVTEPVSAQDRMVLTTGIELEGEIKSARRGEVDFDNDELDVVTVDVADIAVLTSPAFFEVQTTDLVIYRGSLEAAGPGSVSIATEQGPVVIAITDIVRLESFDSGFLSRTNGFADVGINIARANQLRSFFADGAFRFRGPTWGFGFTGDFYSQSQDARDNEGTVFEQSTQRASFGGTLTRNLGSRWALQASGNWERNEELALDSRLQFGGGVLYDFAETQAMEARAGIGLVNNTEDYVGTPTSTTAEIQGGIVLDIFDVGDIDVYSAFTTFTNLTESGRFRYILDGRVAWEFIDDFNLGISVKERFDNQPPRAGAPKRDFQYGLTLGFSWG